MRLDRLLKTMSNVPSNGSICWQERLSCLGYASEKAAAYRFWRKMLALLAVHFAVFIIVIYRWPDLKIAWLCLLMLAESAVLSRLMSSSGREF